MLDPVSTETAAHVREPVFSDWSSWKQRSELLDVCCPGIYALAIGGHGINGRAFTWLETIVYVGMTVAVQGLAGRLRQFDQTISGKQKLHGGADRFHYRHQNYEELVEKLFVSIAPYPCSPNTNQPEDLRIMGDIAKCEYECLARFVAMHGRLPEFNDKSRSPKYSLTVGRMKTID